MQLLNRGTFEHAITTAIVILDYVVRRVCVMKIYKIQLLCRHITS